ncbi:prolipoprotein diacylglyceryl transferase [Candidatus Peregrinibacteria bacterium]|nr:prolipoprotein diacylglyceryl transferase [Candidatus Peregrinibacteria bacterium]
MVFVNSFDPVLFEVGPLSVRWYGLLFGLGLILGYAIVFYAAKREKYLTQHIDSALIYLFLGLVIGARLGHVFFYNAEYFLNNPANIIKIWNGGLSSHGAALGILVAYTIWVKVKKIPFSKYTDIFILGMPIVAGCVRLGNFFNSEIIGKPTGGDWGVIFANLSDNTLRHPTQIYESLSSFAIFAILYFVYRKWYRKTPPMFLMMLYVLLYFVSRFIVEFWKERHILSFDFPLSMGQVLSILPIVIALIFFIFFYPRMRNLERQ